MPMRQVVASYIFVGIVGTSKPRDSNRTNPNQSTPHRNAPHLHSSLFAVVAVPRRARPTTATTRTNRVGSCQETQNTKGPIALTHLFLTRSYARQMHAFAGRREWLTGGRSNHRRDRRRLRGARSAGRRLARRGARARNVTNMSGGRRTAASTPRRGRDTDLRSRSPSLALARPSAARGGGGRARSADGALDGAADRVGDGLVVDAERAARGPVRARLQVVGCATIPDAHLAALMRARDREFERRRLRGTTSTHIIIIIIIIIIVTTPAVRCESRGEEGAVAHLRVPPRSTWRSCGVLRWI